MQLLHSNGMWILINIHPVPIASSYLKVLLSGNSRKLSEKSLFTSRKSKWDSMDVFMVNTFETLKKPYMFDII